jgi:hypothetical protein
MIYYKLKHPNGIEDYYERNIVMSACGGVGRTFGMSHQAKDLPQHVQKPSG